MSEREFYTALAWQMAIMLERQYRQEQYRETVEEMRQQNREGLTDHV